MVPEASIRIKHKEYMKRITLIFLALAALLTSGPSIFAQGKWGPDSAQCLIYLSYYREYYKQKAYDDAIPNWRKAYAICPASSSQNLLIEGTTLVRRLIKANAANPKYSAELIDTLLTLHDQRAELYPKYAVTALNNKGQDIANFLRNDLSRRFEGYEGIIDQLGPQTKSNLLVLDLQSAIELFQEGSIDTEDVLKVYQRNVELLNQSNPRTDIEKQQNEKASADMSSIFAASKIATCDHIIEIFTPRLDADPENLDLATNIVKIMSITEECNNNDLFLRAVSTMYKLSPSANSAYYLFKLHSSNDNVEEAVKYMEEAIASEESDVSTDAEWNYELAVYSYKNGRIPRAYDLASTVVNTSSDDSLKGKAYFLMGNIWGSTTCGGDEIARRAPFWVASDYMQKAKAADPTLAEEADKYLSQYRIYFPAAADAFMYDIADGQSYTVVCGGLKAITTVRTTK